jgi:hypothetical protein
MRSRPVRAKQRGLIELQTDDERQEAVELTRTNNTILTRSELLSSAALELDLDLLGVVALLHFRERGEGLLVGGNGGWPE